MSKEAADVLCKTRERPVCDGRAIRNEGRVCCSCARIRLLPVRDPATPKKMEVDHFTQGHSQSESLYSAKDVSGNED